MSTLRVNNLTNVGGTGPTYASGMVIQTLQTVKYDTFSASLTANTNIEIPGLTVSISPKSVNSKILVTAHVHIATSGDAASLSLKRNSTYIGVGNADGVRQQRSMVANYADNLAAYRTGLVSMSFLDSPATTSNTIYSVDISTALAGMTRTLFINRSNNDDNAASVPRLISTITVQEIAA